jgi:hypothetical protein
MRRFLAASLFLFVCVARLNAADGILDQLPEGTVIAVQIHGLDRTQARVTAMVNAIGPEIGAGATQGLEQLKAMVLQGRELKGGAKDGRVALALFDFPSGPELAPAVVLIETADYKAVRDSIGGAAGETEVTIKENDSPGVDAVTRAGTTLYFVKRGGYTAIAQDAKVAASVAKAKSGRSVSASKHLTASFEDADLSAYVDVAAVRKQFGPVIQQAREQVGGIVAMAAAMQGGADPEAMKAQTEMMQKVIEGTFQLFDDTAAAIVAAKFDKAGLTASFMGDVAAESPTGTALAKFKPGTNPTLARLPDGNQMYFAFNDQALMQAVQGLSGSMFQTLGPTGQALEKQMAAWAGAGPGASAGAVRMGKGYGGFTLSAFAKPAVALEASIAAMEAMTKNKSMGAMMIKEMKVERNAGEHRGIKLTRSTTTLDFEKMAAQPNGELVVAQMKAMMGEQMVQWLGANENYLFQVMEPNLAAVKARLDQVLDQKRTVAQDPGFVEATKRLPARNTLVMVMDLPSLVGAVMQQMMAALGGGAAAAAAPAGKPSYVGVAIVAQPGNYSLDLWIPGAAVTQLMQTAQGLRGIQ